MQDKNSSSTHPVTNNPPPTYMLSGRTLWKLLKLRMRVAAGKIFNLAGIPGLIRECDYHAGITDARVKVQTGDIYTVVNVDGLDIYFHRLTGSIDGVGLSDCKLGPTPESGLARERFGPVPRQPAQTRSQ